MPPYTPVFIGLYLYGIDRIETDMNVLYQGLYHIHDTLYGTHIYADV